MRLEDRNKAHDFLRMWEKNHNDEKLRADVKDQWTKGNRGQKGEWK
jgi:hypothetical protein